MQATSTRTDKKTPQNITTYMNPKPVNFIPLISRLHAGQEMCYPNINPSVLTGYMTKASIIIFAWNSETNEPPIQERTIDAILITSNNNPLNLDNNIFIEAVCTKIKGYGKALFDHLLGLVQDNYQHISLQTADEYLIEVYKKWGFKKAFDKCTGKCYMIYTIKN
jgi:hypothetical protein